MWRGAASSPRHTGNQRRSGLTSGTSDASGASGILRPRPAPAPAPAPAAPAQAAAAAGIAP